VAIADGGLEVFAVWLSLSEFLRREEQALSGPHGEVCAGRDTGQMGSHRRYAGFQIDVFTREAFSGNPAGVVLNADGLSAAEMQKIARELNNSETAFVFAPTSDDHDVWVRFFTPTCEVPSCGHATLAAHYARTLFGGGQPGQVRHKCSAGILPIKISRAEDNSVLVRMTQGRPEFAGLDSDQIPKIVAALGLHNSGLDSRCPIEVVSTGHSKVLVGVADSEILNSLDPDLSALAELSRRIGINGYFVFTLHPESDAHIAESRMFAPAIGIAEDPVTGNGNGPLGAYLVKHGFTGIQNGTFIYQGLQGRKMGRPGVVKGAVEIVDGEPTSVEIGEDAVAVFSFDIHL
jgi:PhzF family phenazine biosynthesis protein